MEKDKVKKEEILPVEDLKPELPKSRQRIKERYPDDTFETDDDWENGINRAFDEDAEKLGKFEISEKQINDLLSANPELLQTFIDIMSGMPGKVAFKKNYEIDIPLTEEDEDYEAWKTMREKKTAEAKERKDREETWAKNESESFSRLDKFYDENGFTEEQRNEFDGIVTKLVEDLMNRNLSDDLIRGLHKSLNYDADVSAAEEAGILNGKNAKIERQIAKSEKIQKGDGLPPAVPAAANIPTNSNRRGQTEEDYEKSKNRIHSKFV
jgi:hypothetical protein